MTNLVSAARSTEVDAFNTMLEYLMLPPVSAVTNLLGDHAIAYNKLIAVHRRVGSRGWYCFNRLDRQTPAWDAVANAYVVPFAWAVRTSERLPCDPEFPQVRLNAQGRLVRMDTGTPAFTDEERTRGLLVDVIRAADMGDAPEAYRAYVAAQAAAEIAPGFGAEVHPAHAENALGELMRVEDEWKPVPNMLFDNATVLHTWAAR